MTTLESARDVWWFMTKRGARVVVVCQSQTDQAALKDIAYKFRLFFDSLKNVGVQLNFSSESRTEWALADRDSTLRIIQAGASEASAEKKGRGGTINRLHISEAAFFERAEETFNSLLESVPKDGSEVVNESTPNGAGGFYYEQWRAAEEGRSAYKAHFFPWWLHPDYRLPLAAGERFTPRTQLETTLLGKGVPVECLNWYRWKVAEKGGNTDLVAQEFPSDPVSCFIVSGRCFFDQVKTSELLAKAQEPRFNQTIRDSGITGQVHAGREVPALRVWYEPEAGRQYVVSADTSEGAGGDPSAAMVLERGSGRHMATLWGQFRPRVLAGYLKQLAVKFNGAAIVVERNEYGGTVLAAFEAEHRYPNVWRTPDGKAGFRTDMVTRPLILATLEQAHREGPFETNDKFLLAEMRTFIVDKSGKPCAQSGAHDDLVMAMAIGWHAVCLPVQRRSSDWVSQLPSA